MLVLLVVTRNLIPITIYFFGISKSKLEYYNSKCRTESKHFAYLCMYACMCSRNHKPKHLQTVEVKKKK